MVSSTDFSKNNLTGGQKRFLELVKGISKKSNVILLANADNMDFDNHNVTLYKLKNISIRHIPKHICGLISQYTGLLKIRKIKDYNFVISFSPISTICYKFAGFKNIVSLFRENLIEYQRVLGASKLKIMYFSLQEIMAVCFSEKIIVQCQQDRNDLIRRNRKFCKNIERKVFIQINNVNASWMNNNLPIVKKIDSEPKILFVGNFSDKRKGHDILLKAASMLLDKGYRFLLYIAGGGNELTYFQEKYKKYPQIIFLNHVTDVNKYLQLCDFEIVPSLIDSCPNTVLEAINAGVAVYGSNVGGIPDILGDEKYMFEPNVKSLYNFLQKIIVEKSYINDTTEQSLIKKRLTFDWTESIIKIITD